MENKDCFAYKERNRHSGCKALKEIDCENCKFYKNDINEAEIERDVSNYAKRYSTYKR